MSKELSTKTTIRNLTAEIKKSFVKKDAFTPVQIAAEKAIKSVGVTGNTISFFASTDKTGTAAFTVDFPTEMFLDQTKTEFVPSFAFSETTYPGATDPKLEGKPVMVLAVKGENPNSCTYSFLSMAALVDTYKAKATGKDKSTTVTIADYEVDVKVNVSAAAGNILTLKDDGLYVPTPEKTDITGLLATDIVDVTPQPESHSVARAAGFIPTESMAGKLRLRAASVPTAAIKAQYHITNTVKYTE